MKPKRVIKFQSRYPNVWSKITEIGKKTWQYDTNSQFMRFGFDDKTNSINFVDPEGGPFISVGSIIEKKHIVSKIYRDKATNKILFLMK